VHRVLDSGTMDQLGAGQDYCLRDLEMRDAEDNRVRGVTRGRASFRALGTSRKAAKPQNGTQKSFRGKLVIFSAAGCVNEPEIVANALRGGFGLHYGHHVSVHLIIAKHVIQKNHNLGAKGDDERMPGGWGTWPRTPIGDHRAGSG
jgi:hypothetical protein